MISDRKSVAVSDRENILHGRLAQPSFPKKSSPTMTRECPDRGPPATEKVPSSATVQVPFRYRMLRASRAHLSLRRSESYLHLRKGGMTKLLIKVMRSNRILHSSGSLGQKRGSLTEEPDTNTKKRLAGDKF